MYLHIWQIKDFNLTLTVKMYICYFILLITPLYFLKNLINLLSSWVTSVTENSVYLNINFSTTLSSIRIWIKQQLHTQTHMSIKCIQSFPVYYCIYGVNKVISKRVLNLVLLFLLVSEGVYSVPQSVWPRTACHVPPINQTISISGDRGKYKHISFQLTSFSWVLSRLTVFP